MEAKFEFIGEPDDTGFRPYTMTLTVDTRLRNAILLEFLGTEYQTSYYIKRCMETQDYRHGGSFTAKQIEKDITNMVIGDDYSHFIYNNGNE